MINPPLDVVFLEFYKNFLVLTKDSLRVYNGNNGRLRMYLDKIVEVDEMTGSSSELTLGCHALPYQLFLRQPAQLRLGIVCRRKRGIAMCEWRDHGRLLH